MSTLPPARPWTPEDDAAMRARYPSEDTQDLADEWGRGYKAVIYRAHILRLRKDSGYRAKCGAKGGSVTQARRPWTDQHDAYLLQHSKPPYSFTITQLAEDLSRSPQAVRQRLALLQSGRPPCADVEQEKRCLIDGLTAHIVNQPDMTPARLAAIVEKVKRLRGMPNNYWRGWANRPLGEWIAEVVA